MVAAANTYLPALHEESLALAWLVGLMAPRCALGAFGSGLPRGFAGLCLAASATAGPPLIAGLPTNAAESREWAGFEECSRSHAALGPCTEEDALALLQVSVHVTRGSAAAARDATPTAVAPQPAGAATAADRQALSVAVAPAGTGDQAGSTRPTALAERPLLVAWLAEMSHIRSAQEVRGGAAWLAAAVVFLVVLAILLVVYMQLLMNKDDAEQSDTRGMSQTSLSSTRQQARGPMQTTAQEQKEESLRQSRNKAASTGDFQRGPPEADWRAGAVYMAPQVASAPSLAAQSQPLLRTDDLSVARPQSQASLASSRPSLTAPLAPADGQGRLSVASSLAASTIGPRESDASFAPLEQSAQLLTYLERQQHQAELERQAKRQAALVQAGVSVAGTPHPRGDGVDGA